MKNIVLILASLVAFTFIGCGDSGSDGETSLTDTTVNEEVLESGDGGLPAIPQIPADE